MQRPAAAWGELRSVHAAWRVLRTYAEARPAQAGAIIAAFLVAGLVEGVGVLSIVPLLEILMDGGAPDSAVGRLIADLLGRVGIELSLLPLLVLVAGAIAVKVVIVVAANLVVVSSIAELVAGMRRGLAEAVLSAEWRYFVQRPVGALASTLGVEAKRAANTTRNALQMIATMIQVAVYLVSAMVLSWQVALGAAAVGLVLLGLLDWFVRLARRAGDRQTGHMASLMRDLVEGLEGLKPLKAMAREQRLLPRFDHDIDGLRRVAVLQGISQSSLQYLPELVLAIVFAIGAYVALAMFRIPLAELLLVSFLSYRVLTRLSSVQGSLQKVVNGLKAIEVLEGETKHAQALREPTAGRMAPRFENGVALDGVSVSFDGVAVVAGATLEVPALGTTALIGPSGSGKTTIADLITGLRRPDRGVVRVDGIPLSEIDLRLWRRMIGYVPQEITLFHDSILANVTLSDPDLGREQAVDALIAAEIWDFVEAEPDGLDTIVGTRGLRMSGGQRQRIALARALVHRPRLVILDEATSALDPDTEARICATLARIARHTAILAISHQPAITSIASRIYSIDNGVVTEVSTQSMAAK